MKADVLKCDVLVVGSGMAGMCAALTALEAGCSVLILESEKAVGGTTALSDGYFSCFDPKRQIRSRIEDSPEKHLSDVLRVGRSRNHAHLSRTFCYEALPALSWLEGMGFEFSDRIVQAEGSPYPRCHQPKNGTGKAYIEFLEAQLKRRGAPIMTGVKVERVRFSAALNRVVGADAIQDGRRILVLASSGVVLACGGYQSNPRMLATYSPMLDGVKSMGAAGCTGELQAGIEDVGAQVVHSGYYVWRLRCRSRDVLLHPEKFILLDENARRFCREDLQFDALGERILQLENKTAWCASREVDVDEAPFTTKRLDDAVAAYNAMANQGYDSSFGKNSRLLYPLHGRIGTMSVDACICTTLGGVFIDEYARVLDRNRVPISGLTAAGDCTGGVFGCWAAVGDLLASAAVFGRIAGRTLASST